MTDKSTMSKNLNHFFIHIEDELLSLTSYWFRIVSSSNESLLTEEHRHTFYELQYVVKGEIRIMVKEQSYTLKDGSFIIVPPDTPHRIFGYAKDTEKAVFGFSLSPKEERLRFLFERTKQVRIYNGSEKLAQFLNLLLSDANEGEVFSYKVIQNMTECFTLELANVIGRQYPMEGSPFVKYSRSKKMYDDITRYISRNIGKEKITVSSLADMFHISSRQLNRIFRECSGMTLNDTIRNYKIDLIKTLALTTDYSLRDIAYICNFSDVYSLIRFFKSMESMTPNVYRKKSNL